MKMEEAVRIMKAHGKLIRYDGGFWSWISVEIHDAPIWYCGVGTLRALAKRGAVILDEENKSCQLL